ncbi:MAG: hypothetical protein ACTSUS_00810 [Candidatus Freyarchaeota archaeon]
MKLLDKIRIVKVEDRTHDAWFDLSLRQIREGEVRFYRVKDFLTGEWLFKTCLDKEKHRVIVRAVKCPPGRRYAQLEGDTMVFQKGLNEGWLYDVVSLTYADEEDRLHRKILRKLEEIPAVIRENFEVKPYEEATGRKAPGKYLVTLVKESDDKAMITLFLLERAWPICLVPPEVELKIINLLALVGELEKAKLEEVYTVAQERFGITRNEVDALLRSLEERGKIERPKDGYVKIIR